MTKRKSAVHAPFALAVMWVVVITPSDKPVIVVNLRAAKAEGSDLTGQILKAATIIGQPAGGSATP